MQEDKLPLLSYAIRYWPDYERRPYKCLDWSTQLQRDFFSKESATRTNWTLAYYQNNRVVRYVQGDLPVLNLACGFGIEELVLHLVSKRPYALGFLRPIAMKNKWRETALFNATRGGWEEVVELLLKHGASINTKNSKGNTPIVGAIVNGDRAMVELLLNKGAKVDSRRAHLMLLQPEESIAMTKLLIEYGADVNGIYGSGTPILAEASFLETSLYSKTALWYAIANGHEAVAQLLLNHGADVNEKYNASYGSALDVAASKGNPAIVRMLLKNGAKIDNSRRFSHTAFWWAIRGGHEAVARLLINFGADINEKYNDNKSALEEAAVSGHAAILMLLLRKQDPDWRTLACRKALDPAVNHGYTGAVQELLKWGANPVILTGSALALFEASRDGDRDIHGAAFHCT